MRSSVTAWRGGVALTGLLVAAGGLVTVLTPATGAVVVAASGDERAVAWLILAGAVALVAAGAVAWASRPGAGVALIAFWAAAAWLAPELVGSAAVTSEARSLGRLLAPMLIPLAVHLPIRALRDGRGPVRPAVALLYVAVALASLGHAVTWDPFKVVDCAPFCHQGDNRLAWFSDKPVAIAFRAAGWTLSVVGGLGLVVWMVARARRGFDPRNRAVLVAAGFTGVALVALGWAGLASDPEDAALDTWMVRATAVMGIALTTLGTAVAWIRIGDARRAAGLRGLVELLDAGAGTRSLEGTLARVLHDPTVRVAYPVDGGCIDEQGRAAEPPAAGPGRAVLPIERAGATIALVEHAADLDEDLLATQVGAAARLAVDNERLAAMLRAQLRALQASRERIVAAGDAARGRLERDLHDGAQQRLLAVSYELRLAQAAAGELDGRRASLAAAVGDIDRGLAELRELAHGLWPAVLAEAGLEPAIASLADEAPIPVEVGVIADQRFAGPTEAAAYLAVTEAMRRAVAAEAGRLVVSARRIVDQLRLEVWIPGRAIPGPWLRVDDRAGAAGGRSEVTVDPAAGTLLTVELPCA